MEEKKLKLELSMQELDTIYRGLLELPTKFALPVMQSLETKVKEHEAGLKEEKKAE